MKLFQIIFIFTLVFINNVSTDSSDESIAQQMSIVAEFIGSVLPQQLKQMLDEKRRKLDGDDYEPVPPDDVIKLHEFGVLLELPIHKYDCRAQSLNNLNEKLTEYQYFADPAMQILVNIVLEKTLFTNNVLSYCFHEFNSIIYDFLRPEEYLLVKEYSDQVIGHLIRFYGERTTKALGGIVFSSLLPKNILDPRQNINLAAEIDEISQKACKNLEYNEQLDEIFASIHNLVGKREWQLLLLNSEKAVNHLIYGIYDQSLTPMKFYLLKIVCNNSPLTRISFEHQA